MNKTNFAHSARYCLTCLAIIFCGCIAVVMPVTSMGTAAIQTDPAAPREVIVRFLKWYKANLKKANSLPFLVKDNAGNYMLNQVAADSYLSLVKSSGCVTQRYIDYWKTYFDDKATMLKEQPVQSYVPEGFDFDLVLISQEPELILNKIGRLTFKTISMKGTNAVIAVRCPGDLSIDYEFEMQKTTAGWQIVYISTNNYD